MKILIAEDDFMSRKLMLACLSHLGECDVAVGGREAVEAFTLAFSIRKPYDLVMLDIMNGQEVLKRIRLLEYEQNPKGDGVKVIMTTALKDSCNVMDAFENQCDGYLVKPIEFDKVHELLKSLGLQTE